MIMRAVFGKSQSPLSPGEGVGGEVVYRSIEGLVKECQQNVKGGWGNLGLLLCKV
jgi:hypothetical protein